MGFVENLVKEGWLKTPRIIEAFQKIKRVDFLPALPAGRPEDFKNLAELNEALPIGFNQTISQPLVVAFMLELLQPQAGDKILDVGSGSGWTSALLAHIVSGGELKSKTQNQKSKINGRVVALEVVPELMEFGKKNAAKYSFLEKGIAEFILADGSKGYQKEAPFNKILASASLTAASKIPPAWKNQLKIGGRIVAPIGNSVWLFIKNPPVGGKRDFQEKEYPGFVFVPLVKQ
ncbi:MAG: protein-L-isoaspartate O-methyltransferase [bacterium]